MKTEEDFHRYEVRYSIELGERLRTLRHRHGLSQEEVAYRAGIATYTYRKFEKGKSKPGTPMNPTLHTLLALGNVFGIGIAELLDIEVSEQQ